MDTDIVISSSNSLQFTLEDPSCSYENNLHNELEDLFLIEAENEPPFQLEACQSTQETQQERPEELDEDLLSDEDEDEIAVALFNEEQEIETLERTALSLQDVKPLPEEVRTTIVYTNEEESAVITECQDPVLKNLLILNRAKAAHLTETMKKLLKLEGELLAFINRQKMAAAHNLATKEVQTVRKTCIWRIGMPFFKDKHHYRAPHNGDYHTKMNNKEFLAVVIKDGPRWHVKDQKALQSAVLESHFHFQKNKQEQEIRVVKAKVARNPDDPDLQDTLDGLLEQLDLFKKKKEPPPLNCNEGIDWLKISTTDLKGRHPYQQCKAFWNIYLHPHINKSNWTEAENETIKELVSQHRFDWELIARELNTSRSPYLVCIHFNTKLCDRFKRERFLPDEDDLLMEAIEHCRLGEYIPWGRVSSYFDHRSKIQLYHRYHNYLSYSNKINKGWFTEAEDILLLHLVDRFGKDFQKIAQYMPRGSMQLRHRFSNYLEKMLCLNLGSFTIENDRKILRHVKENGLKNWNILGKELNRARSHVRQRYFTVSKFLDRNSGATLEDVPRRTQRYFLNNNSDKRARYKSCLQKLEALKGIPKLSTVEVFLEDVDRSRTEVVRVNRGLPVKRKQRSDMDEQLVEFFMGTCRFQRRCKLPLTDSFPRIAKLLHFLGLDMELIKNASSEGLAKEDAESLQKIKELVNNPSFKLPPVQVSQLLPPTVNTLLALRGLIVKYQLLKDSVEKPPAAQNEQIREQRELFYKRLHMVLKWPSILSRAFPAHLAEKEEKEKVEVEKRKPGRPLKSYDKILKMVEAKKRKKSEMETEESLVVEEEEPEERKKLRPTYDKVMKVVEARNMKRSSSGKRPQTKGTRAREQPDYALAYIPKKYGSRKNKEGLKDEDDAQSDPDDVLPSTSQSCDDYVASNLSELIANSNSEVDTVGDEIVKKDLNSEFVKKYSIRLEELPDDSSDDEVETPVLNPNKNIDSLKSTIQKIQRKLQEKNAK